MDLRTAEEYAHDVAVTKAIWALRDALGVPDEPAVTVALWVTGATEFYWQTVARQPELKLMAMGIKGPRPDYLTREISAVPENQLETVARIRATYHTPLGSKHAAFLLELARALSAGLLRKDTGTNVMLPDGTRVAQDIICYPDGRIYDVLGDGEGAATPQWSEADGSPVDRARFYAVATSLPGPSVPTPPPDTDRIAKLEQRIALLEQKLTGASKAAPRLIALRSQMNGRIVCADAADHGGVLIPSRDQIGAWETFELIVVEP